MTKDHEAIVQVIKVALDHHDWRLVRHLTRLIEMLDAAIDDDDKDPPFIVHERWDHLSWKDNHDND